MTQVSLEDLYKGKTAKLAVSRDKIVGKSEVCRDCNGRGVIVRLRQLGPGMVQQIQQQYVCWTFVFEEFIKVHVKGPLKDVPLGGWGASTYLFLWMGPVPRHLPVV